jgi:hypothetical protein
MALGNWTYGIYLWPTHYAVMAIFAAIGYPVSSLEAIQCEASSTCNRRRRCRPMGVKLPHFEMPFRGFVNRLHWAGLPPSGHFAG